MTTNVAFRNPRTGQIKEVKVGWSWTLFFFAGVMGIPLFLRKLNAWGFLFLALWTVNALCQTLVSDPIAKSAALLVYGIILLALKIWIAKHGNQLTAENYLDCGWEFVDPQSEPTKYAKAKWWPEAGLAEALGLDNRFHRTHAFGA
jgi:hypothetical protein